MTTLGCHAEKSPRVSLQLINLKLASGGLGEALSKVKIGVFILDALGHVLFVNPSGRDLITNGLTLSKESL